MKTNPSSQELLRLADQCVKCGLCLPSCPTYAVARNEADSPRGRISLIQGWLSGDLALTDTLAGHLDGCLTCRACETACPSLVAYGRLADGAKALRVEALPARRSVLRRGWLAGLSDARIAGALGRLARIYRRSGLARLAELASLARLRWLRPYHRLASAMGLTARRIMPLDPPAADLDLFIGCMGSSAQGTAIEAALKVCERLGLRVRMPSEPACCGALLRHNGYPAEADARRANCARIHAGRVLVGLASACIAELREDPTLRDTWELCEFLDRAAWPETLALHPLPRRVLVHEPCSHRNLLGGNAAVYRLLARIPELEIAPLPGNDRCCGAAGTYLLQQPVMADALLREKLAPLSDLKPEIIATTNPGCALHLAAGIREAGLAIEVCHPVELIARQMDG
ncbi:(Fe-S)-binding protein [Thiocystis violascens]|uniref:Glycolate oxidase iron-sulfur subunit n=1 Tax=Thiocystis violascens (strain ATCC 17096 / DSM 198 / 6111) TaxID=765911 RepID=I3YEN9_THIV6|nr:(Fe-S)-binding protein [Thiocystis violascens]AFL75457.1 Fe-S oxidoreductase [Thiocystis violascens DSM 198]